LSIGRSPIQTYIDVQAVTRLARFLESRPVGVTSVAGLDRAMLERYLADLATDTRALRTRSRDISSLGVFLEAIRRHEWDRTLPASAAFYPDDFPKPEKRLPRGLAELGWRGPRRSPPRVRNETMARSNRFCGMARTRWMSPAWAGSRTAA
jgi:hypothetical protein